MVDTSQWQQWLERVQRGHQALDRPVPTDAAGQRARSFFDRHYAGNQPLMGKLPDNWPLHRWTPADIRARVANADVQVQAGRDADPDFETNGVNHKTTMLFYDFLDKMDGNDVYMTANNAALNTKVLQALFADFDPLPLNIRPPADIGFIWLGGKTLTPLHHDLSNNLMCQLMGRKQVRLARPGQVDKLKYDRGVFSSIKWLTDAIVAEQGVDILDVTLAPGEYLFVPVGWWHCCLALETSATVTFTNFPWPNNYNPGP